MFLPRHARARFNLVDGSTIEGTVRSRWTWWGWRLSRPVVQTGAGPIEAEGFFWVARRHVLSIQVLHIEAESSEE
ncbi:hypothetical protein RN607_00660 [Demequina capsici]|uniref:Uncharacterized protein n=1 Tax=Demequina capsici TaxID=3075620 RepID=A0AA96FDE4_9MICO|nr:hypothetical protein [Demequina sp. PMTSA13]WNM27544.1 hypothetical protein RN607_00660 [Demequina sp. PMTSA13]